jgi:hypothetical protein
MIDFLGFDQLEGKKYFISFICLHFVVYSFFRAFVYLTNLLYGLSLVQNVAIISERGDIKGYLKIAIQQLQASTQETTNEQIKLMKTYRNASGLTKIAFDDETYFQVKKDTGLFFQNTDALLINQF